MTTLLLCWYAMGWVAAGVWCRMPDQKNMSLEELAVAMIFGPFLLGFNVLLWASRNHRDVIVWRKK